MTAEDFRRMALSMPEARESTHMGHPDFRVNGKIFATLFTVDEEERGMVKLKPGQQREFIKAKPNCFEAVKGGWGRRGCTQVHLDSADKATVRRALIAAWRNTATKGMIEKLDGL